MLHNLEHCILNGTFLNSLALWFVFKTALVHRALAINQSTDIQETEHSHSVRFIITLVSILDFCKSKFNNNEGKLGWGSSLAILRVSEIYCSQFNLQFSSLRFSHLMRTFIYEVFNHFQKNCVLFEPLKGLHLRILKLLL